MRMQHAVSGDHDQKREVPRVVLKQLAANADSQPSLVSGPVYFIQSAILTLTHSHGAHCSTLASHSRMYVRAVLLRSTHASLWLAQPVVMNSMPDTACVPFMPISSR